MHLVIYQYSWNWLFVQHLKLTTTKINAQHYLVFVIAIYRLTLDSPYKGPVMRTFDIFVAVSRVVCGVICNVEVCSFRKAQRHCRIPGLKYPRIAFKTSNISRNELSEYFILVENGKWWHDDIICFRYDPWACYIWCSVRCCVSFVRDILR